MLSLYHQAVAQGLIDGSEAGRIDFFCFAERARTRGDNPGGLLRWLLVNRRTEYITQAEEDAAVRKLREYRDGPRRTVGEGGCVSRSRPVKIELTEDERFVQACLVVAQRNQRFEPYQIALEAKGWSRKQWENAHAAFEARQLDRWRWGDQEPGELALR